MDPDAPDTETGTDEGDQEVVEDGPQQRPERDELQAHLDEANDRIGALEEKLDTFTNALARTQADFDNYRKRAKRERDEAAAAARVELLRTLAGVLDDLTRARDSSEPGSPVADGIGMVERRIQNTLGELGVVELAPGAGDAFQPEVHEVLLSEATDEHPPGTVLETLQRGYILGDRLVRPAMVKVAAAPGEDGEDEGAREGPGPS